MNASLDPRDHYWVNNSNAHEWREILKLRLLEQRQYKSDLSGKPLTHGCHMHEGILTRANVPKNVWWQYHIYHPFNCFLLLESEHIPNPPSREKCIQIAYDRYGRDFVREWFYSLSFKSFPFQLI